MARGKDDPDGRVIIKAVIDGVLATVKTQFNAEDHAEITRAHTERRTIYLNGELRRQGRDWRLKNPRDLVVENQQ